MQALEHPREADVTVNDAFRPLSAFFDRITRPEQLLSALPEAMRVLLDPAETGAVTLSLHQDVQAEAYDFPASFFEPRTWPVEPPAACGRRAERPSSRRCAHRKRPLLIAGGGVHYSEALAGAGRAVGTARRAGGRDLGRQGRAAGRRARRWAASA